MEVVELSGGIKVYLEDDGGFKVTSVFGEEVCFDRNGNDVSEKIAKNGEKGY